MAFEEAAPAVDGGFDELETGVRARLARLGVLYRATSGRPAFPLDPIPRVIAAADWQSLEPGLIQRVRALNAFVADAYGARRIVAEGVVPERVIDTAGHYEPLMRGVQPPGGQWVGIAGLDLVRDEHGDFRVIEDNLMTPSGFGYAAAARAAVLPAFDAAPRTGTDLSELLGGALHAASPVDGEPYVVVFTDSPDNPAYWEHAWAAEALGVPIVLPEDLRLDGDRLRHGERPVDVVYRRTNADTIDTDEGRLLAPAVQAGTLGVVNAFGCGVGDDKLAHAYVEDMVRFYLGEEPALPSVPSYDLGVPEQLERALDEIDRLVFKPRSGQGGTGVVVAPHADRGEIEAMREKVRESPHEWVAQRYVELSKHPTLIDGALEPRHVDLRPFVFMRGPDDARVLTGGLTRVALGAGEVIVNTSQNGGFKDTWVLDR
jgi:uncharacterized circularly permuted ATP-grasp superfamily protein